MKRLVFIAILVTLVLGGFTLADASLIDNGPDPVTGYHLIYDTNLDITWYNYTYAPVPSPSTSLSQAVAWASSLTVGGVSAWTLPTTPGTMLFAYTSEGQMGELYYTQLGNTAGGPLTNTGPLTKLLTTQPYWYDTLYDANYAFNFYFATGQQSKDGIVGSPDYAIAVHTGDIGPSGVIPIPGAILLFAPGLAGLAAIRRRFKK
jgi:hypothetical protein